MMKRHISILSIAISASLVCLTAPARADVITGGPVYHSGQVMAVCTIHNGGDAFITIREHVIYDASGASLTLSLDSCGATLPAKRTCGFLASVATSSNHSCRVRIDQNAGQVRGRVEVINASGNQVLSAAPMW